MLDSISKPVMQRAKGTLRISFETKNGRSSLMDLHQAGCLKAMIPKNHAPMPDAVMINTAGGLTGGDQLDVSVSVGNGTQLRMATQTAERIYRSTGDHARVKLKFEIGEAARFDWLAQETILFEGGQVNRQINADLAEDASALFVEPVILGRIAMGETLTFGALYDHWRIHRGGKLVYADALRLDNFEALKSPAALGSNLAFATLLFIDPMAEDRRDQLRDLLDLEPIEAGCSAWNGLLLARLMAPDAAQLRKSIIKVTTNLRGRDMPRVWTM